MESNSGLAEAMGHIAIAANMLERVNILGHHAVVAQPLDPTKLEAVPKSGASTASTLPPPSAIALTAPTPQRLTERPLGLQRLHKELGAIGYATPHIRILPRAPSYEQTRCDVCRLSMPPHLRW